MVHSTAVVCGAVVFVIAVVVCSVRVFFLCVGGIWCGGGVEVVVVVECGA